MNEPTFSPLPEEPPSPEAPRRADALPRGTRVAGCEIGRVVADSSFSIVYFAREADSERRFAIKEYLPVSLALRSDDGRGIALRAPEHAEAFERGLQAFAAEGDLLEKRTHPSLVRVLRTWRGNGSIYRVMHWFDGETLLTLRRGMSEPPDEATLRRLLFGLLGALQTLHDAGQAHGAVTPSNIMVLPDDRAVLLDTGAVAGALVGDQTRALMAMVSPGFAQAGSGAAATDIAARQAADLRALAAVAHYAIGGELPASGARPLPLSNVVRNLRLPLGAASYGANLLDTLDAALSDDPKRCFRTVGEFRAALANPAAAPRFEIPGASFEPTLGVSEPYLAAAASGIKLAVAPAVKPVGYRARRAESQRRRGHLITWLAAGAFATLIAGTVTLGLVKERDASDLRAGATGGNSADTLPAPAARVQAPTPVAPPVAVAPPEPAPAPVIVSLPTPAPALIAAPKPITEPAPAPLPAPAAAVPAAPPPPAAVLAAPPPVVAERPAEPPQAVAELAAPARREPERLAPPAARAERPARTAAPKEPAAAVARGPSSPRAVCGARTEFALYRCMTTECQKPTWTRHAQCERLRQTDEVD